MKKVISVLLSVIMISVISAGCTQGAKGGINYPDFPLTPEDGDSWDYIADNETFEINWFVGTSFTEFAWGADTITKKIKEKLGVTVNFIVPTEDADGYLQNLISANRTPDVVTLSYTSHVAKLLVTQQYAYPIDELARRWAPSLNRRLNEQASDMVNYFTANYDNLYWLPSHSWVDEDAEKSTPMANGAILVREDLYNWFTHKYPDVDVMSKDGYYTMCKTVYDTFNTGSAVTGKVDGINKVYALRGIEVGDMTNVQDSGIEYLAEFFAAPYEDKDGNYIDKRKTEQYAEALGFLNKAYNDGVISKANLEEKSDGCAQALANGKVFSFIGKPQNYTTNFRTCYNSYGYNYIPLIVTNGNGDDPIVQSESKYAYCYNMITNASKRPDLIIKLFDWMWSDEGQLMCMWGEEDVSWKWTDETETKLNLTDTFVHYKKAWGRSNASLYPQYAADSTKWPEYGAYNFWLMERTSYYRSVIGDNMWTYLDIMKFNMRLPIAPVTYNYSYSFVDCFATGNNAMNVISNNIESYWANNVLSIIQANESRFKTVYDSVIASMNAYGWDDLISYYNTAFKKVKAKMNITYAWPLNDPSFESKIKNSDGSYKISPNGNASYKLNYEAIDAEFYA